MANAQDLQLQQALAASLQSLRNEQAITRQRSVVTQLLAGYGYHFQDLSRDGNCFYRVLAAHYQEQVTADVMRKEVA